MYLNAMSLYRVGRWCLQKKVPLIPRVMEGLIFLLFNSSIPVSTSIGSGTTCGHRGIACVINSDAIIGKNVLIRPQVLIGGGAKPGVPIIEDDVEIGAGAKILGGIVVGRGARIGANAVVIDDIPAESLAVGVPARVVEQGDTQ